MIVNNYKLKSDYQANIAVKNLLAIKEANQLANNILRIKTSELIKIINENKYTYYNVPKKKGGYREIAEPNNELKDLQVKLNYYFQAVYSKVRPISVHGFMPSIGKNKEQLNIVSNALPHVGKKHVVNLDIQNYFGTITSSRIKSVFEGELFNFPSEIAILLALLCTHKKCLPQGAPSSPILANICTYEMDVQLQNLCAQHNVAFTRYADDLSFSSNDFINNDFITSVNLIFTKNNFKLNPKKQRLQSCFRQQTVTGIVVNEKVNINRKYIRKIRAILHSIENYGIEISVKKHYKLEVLNNKEIVNEKFKRKLKGMIEFVGMVRGKNDLIYTKFKNQFMVLYPNKV